MPSKHEKNRKQELDADTSIGEGREERRRHYRSRSRSPKNEESMSIEETNKLRAKLGLAPLDLDDKSNTEPMEKDDGSGEKVFTEDGVEIVHKPSRNWSDEKRQKELKEKLDHKKRQRDLHSKVLKSKSGLAEEENEEIENTTKWIERSRRIEEEMRKAKEKEKQLDEMDESFGIGALLKEEQQKKQKKREAKTEPSSGGLIVGHSVQDFQEGRETILVLQDKSLLLDGEDADEEVLINPNMVENERTKLNVERRKKKATHYQAYEEEEIDEFGQIKRKEILDKYDEGMDGEAKKKETFRLDETGHYDLDKEAKEAEARRKLMMVNKKFESLGETKYTLANEFYTEEEVIQFRRLKKKKTSKNSRKKGSTLKTTELEPLEETEEEKKIREDKLAARRAQDGGDGKSQAFRDTMKEANGLSSKVSRNVVIEEGEIEESRKEIKQAKDSIAMPPPDQTKWKKPKVSVDLKMLDTLAEKIKKREEDEDDEEEFLPHMSNVAPIQIDDDAGEELNAILAKARLLKNSEKMVKKEVSYFASDSSEEDDDEDFSDQKNSNAIIFDATSEKYKAIGGGGYGSGDQIKKVVKMENDEEMDMMSGIASSSSKKEVFKRRRTDSGSSQEFERMDEERDGERSDSDDATKNYSNILGEEKDVTKGVGAMLKLAGQKGYLESGNKRRPGEGSLKHLESKRYSKVEQGHYDIEDKTMRKLERMGTTGTGPTRPFPEKADYTPKIEINYSDKSGRVLEPKEAFRVLSWKFHGKGPGKKQGEKHKMKVDKREKLKKMNSQDTPLGTLNKQLKKQEQLSTAYLVLSGRGDAAPLQKE
uniref:U4/U6.U5 tri-snRNP-associated protein 1 n=1 Tax=Meloidogyne hapla TaxID=6305 RepID=A0A1I8AZM1_MELHA